MGGVGDEQGCECVSRETRGGGTRARDGGGRQNGREMERWGEKESWRQTHGQVGARVMEASIEQRRECASRDRQSVVEQVGMYELLTG